MDTETFRDYVIAFLQKQPNVALTDICGKSSHFFWTDMQSFFNKKLGKNEGPMVLCYKYSTVLGQLKMEIQQRLQTDDKQLVKDVAASMVFKPVVIPERPVECKIELLSQTTQVNFLPVGLQESSEISKVNRIFQCAGDKKLLKNPTLAALARKVHPDKQPKNKEVKATEKQIAKIIRDWEDDSAKLKYVLTEEEEVNMTKFVKARNKSKRGDEHCRQLVFDTIAKQRRPNSSVNEFVKFISKTDKIQRQQLWKYINYKLLKSCKSDKYLEKFDISPDLVAKILAQVASWRKPKRNKTKKTEEQKDSKS